uniref:ARAD1C31592p n=1 Tax=Blastobotrys adeninivorans TaxID=409370 RepID=A0A060T2G2_BLAAD
MHNDAKYRVSLLYDRSEIASDDSCSDSSPDPLIPTNSYTALRLLHAPPRTVDKESRVTVVGPIPIEWIRKNKKKWGSRNLSRMTRLLPNMYRSLRYYTHLSDPNKKQSRVDTLNDEGLQHLEPINTNATSVITDASDFEDIGPGEFDQGADGDDEDDVEELNEIDSIIDVNDWATELRTGVPSSGQQEDSLGPPLSPGMSPGMSADSDDNSSTRLLQSQSPSPPPVYSDNIPDRTDSEANLATSAPLSEVYTSSSMASFVTANQSLDDASQRTPYASDDADQDLYRQQELNETPRPQLRESEQSFENEYASSTASSSTAKPGPSSSTIAESQPVASADWATQSELPDARDYLSSVLERDNQKKVTIVVNEDDNGNAPKVHKVTKKTFRKPHTSFSQPLRRSFYPQRARGARSVRSGTTRNTRASSVSKMRRKRYRVLSGKRLFRRKKTGELLRVGKCLVCVKATMEKVFPNNFNEIETVDTRLVERWKEYVIVARNTGKDSEPVRLQFYTSRNISKIENGHKKTKSSLDITLGRKDDFNVSLYSSLDKSIALVKRLPRGYSRIYILQARSSMHALEWLLFLSTINGTRPLPPLTLNVPDLKLEAQLDLSIEKLRSVTREKPVQWIRYSDLTSFISVKSRLAAIVLEDALKTLTEVDTIKKYIDENWDGKVKLGLAWRRYDRLEWLYDIKEAQFSSSWAMLRSHNLELRPKCPYSIPVTVEDGSTMEEPTAIEGFLSRLNSWMPGGRGKGFFFRKSYLHTHDNLLFYCRANRAIPPYPESSDPSMTLEELAQSIPIVYDTAPFRLDDVTGRIHWITPNLTDETFQTRDKAAMFEIQRRVAMIERSSGFIDLTEVVEVRATETDNIDEFGRELELVMERGDVLRLQAHEQYARDVWVERLQELVTYWKLRAKDRISRTHDIREKNLKLLQIDEDMDAIVGESMPKWETERAMADATLYNISGLSWSRSIHFKGMLFQKPSKFSSFRKYYALLCHGDLILYSPFARDASGVAYPTVSYERYQSISLHDCYVYSGTNITADLLKRDKWFDRDNPGGHSLPRAYPDGWKSAEDESMRCFALWFARKRLRSQIIENVRDREEDVDILSAPPPLRMVNRLGVSGVSMVFMTRSRQERDLWMTALKTEIGRMTDDAFKDLHIT